MKKKNQKWLALLLAVVMMVGMLPMHAFAADTDSVTNYKDFMAALKVLEVYADEYAKSVGRDAGELVLNFIRTGVERYQDDNWSTLAGQEIVGFTSYVEAQDEEHGTNAMSLKNIVIKDFKLPNGNPVDFGHMFGCMNISYVAKGSADLSGWAGDLCDLLRYSVENIDAINENTDGSIESMAAYIQKNCFGVDASGAFGWDDFYGDMDAYYLITEYKKSGGEKKFSAIMENYFGTVEEPIALSDTDRTVYFMNNRFAVADSREAVRKAIYETYSADVGIKVLEAGRGLSSYNALRQACCYAFADYVYSQAKGKLIEGTPSDNGPKNGYYTVFSNEHSILAPGIEQDINYAQTVDGKQIVYYVATVDVKDPTVDILVNYNNNKPPVGSNIGLATVEKQVAALIANNKEKGHFYPIVATNGAGYNTSNGTPAGLVVMQGVEYSKISAPGFFAILSDGTAVIGDQAKYDELKQEGKIKEAIQAFGSVLVKGGKINVTKSANYTANRASRTAIGITAEGKVVMMVLDGRQLPRSAGGSLEEIAQIMLEAGCVDAVNLDGGGSTTYLSKPAGSDNIQLVNVPSDGYPRSVSTSLVAVSTAAPSTAFDHAVVSSDYEYITAGTKMQFSVTGVSNTGNAAAIPEGAYWQTSDENIGTIDKDTGLFTAVANGTVKVQFIANGEVAGEKVINVVVPDAIKFAEDRIVAIYGEAKKMDITVWYQGFPVAFTPLRDAYVFFDYEFDQYGKPKLYFTSDAGYINGLEFVGNDLKNVRTVPVYAALLIGNNIIATAATVNLYYADEATFDFENATQGNRKLAWNREIENGKTLDNQLYHISDPDSPVVIDYTFALDMTAIDFPVQLEPLKSMLPTYQEGATAWTYMLQLAERVCIQTNVTITAEFSKDLEVDIDNLKVVNDYFTLTSVNLDENNVLTLKCNWVNQSQPINAATANPLCILTGITATVKDTAAWFNNEITIANNGYVSYDIYLAASSLYSFAQDPENQAKYGLYPYIHEEDCRSDFVTDDPGLEDGDGSDEPVTDPNPTNNDKGARFSSQYIDFADIYVLDSEVLQGWQEIGNAYYYYKDNIPVTGTQLVTDRTKPEQLRFYEFDVDGKLISEQGKNGLINWEGDLYYAVQGVAQTGWQKPDETTGNNYYFHRDTCKAVDGVQTIKEFIFPETSDKDTRTASYTYTFKDHILVRGDLRKDKIDGHEGVRYRWAGTWIKNCWFEVDGNTYHVNTNRKINGVGNWTCMVTTGFGEYIPAYGMEGATAKDQISVLFDENGVLQQHFTGATYINETYGFRYFKNGVLSTNQGIAQGNDGYYYYVDNSHNGKWVDGSIAVNETINVTVGRGFVDPGTYTFDEFGRLEKNLVGNLVTQYGQSVTPTILGRVMTLKNVDASYKVLCQINNSGKFVQVSAMPNPYAAAGAGEYNFIIPKGATAVKIILNGDINQDGTVDIYDMGKLFESGITAEEMPEADISGNGEVNGADKILLALQLLGLKNLPW